MKTVHLLAPITILAALACQESRDPMAPEGPGAGPVAAAVAACPCWDGGMVATAFPAAHFYLDDGGMAALTRFDNANAQQIQALVRFSEDGQGSCELASYGAGGVVETLMATEGLSGEQCTLCAALLRGPAVTLGLVAAAPEGGSVEP